VIRDHPLATVAVLTVVGYGLVVGTFLGVVPRSVFPDLSLGQVNALSHAIAAVNTVTTLLLIAGWRWIRAGDVRKHAAAMTTSFGLILVFLVMYLTKIGGGGTKEIVIESSGIPGVPAGLVYGVYLAMLAVHIVLSIVAVPVVLYALVLGLTHTPQELRSETPHRRVGRIAAGSWILSLSLGVVTYVLLNHVYAWEYVV
jgi:putative membrane protein